jgi:hypothetical protein
MFLQSSGNSHVDIWAGTVARDLARLGTVRKLCFHPKDRKSLFGSRMSAAGYRPVVPGGVIGCRLMTQAIASYRLSEPTGLALRSSTGRPTCASQS